ncbi:hypothetical protein ACIA8R_52360 [Nonomuraea sp. NPDC051191]|uniref:hypothetical protein n=1 Tax=Nonomuraea sp. NPDC051191 TaxID=3364372 RepID=UPI0037A5B6DE
MEGVLMARRGPKRRLDVESEYRRLVLSGVGTVEACRALGIGRETGYRWRVENGGLPLARLAESALPGDPRIRLPPASPRRYDGRATAAFQLHSDKQCFPWRTDTVLTGTPRCTLLLSQPRERPSPAGVSRNPIGGSANTIQGRPVTDRHLPLVVVDGFSASRNTDSNIGRPLISILDSSDVP